MPNTNRQIFLKRFNSINEKVKSPTSSPTSKNSTQFIHSISQTKKFIDRLEKQAQHEKEKRQFIENKYESFKERFVSRQREFHRILEKYNTHKQTESKDDLYIAQIYQKILCTFDAFNQKARQLLDDRYNELYRLMQRRIDILMQKMDKQLSRYRKISEAERKQIQEDIKEISAIAAQTENQNISFRKKNSELSLKLEMLSQEKKLLLQEIVILKAQLSKLSKKQTSIRKNTQTKDQKLQFWNNQSLKGSSLNKVHQQKKGRILTSRSNNRYGQKTSIDSMKGNTISTMRTLEVSKTQRGIVYSNQQSIINHLKQSLQREKNKNLQLIKFSLQLQAKQQRIKQLVLQQVSKEKTRSSEKSLSQSGNMNQAKKIILSNQVNIYENYLLQDKKQLSILINEINKILHLPQSQNINHLKNKQNQNMQDMLVVSQQVSSIKNDIKDSQVANNSSQRRKLSVKKSNQSVMKSKISNRSIVFHEMDQKLKQSKNSLFINFSPLNIEEITKSIEIQ